LDDRRERLTDIPHRIQQFISVHIQSLEELEILLLLLDNPRKEWGTLAICSALLMERPIAETALVNLENSALVFKRTVADEQLYRINSTKPDQVATLNEVAQWYATHRLKIITLICRQPLNRLQSFADAFRFRKEDEK
jgi:hypothetical protein